LLESLPSHQFVVVNEQLTLVCSFEFQVLGRLPVNPAAVQVCVSQVRLRQLNPLQVRTGPKGINKVRLAKIGSTEVRAVKMGAGDIRPGDDC
jgi:hypothetical protein